MLSQSPAAIRRHNRSSGVLRARGTRPRYSHGWLIGAAQRAGYTAVSTTHHVTRVAWYHSRSPADVHREGRTRPHDRPVEQGGAVGRQFDFLAQEFNREANTLCSKANDPEITRAGLALKVVIDQMREQVQNIE